MFPFVHDPEGEGGPVAMCACLGCRCLRQGKTIEEQQRRIAELARGNTELLLERNAERDAKRATAEHRDRPIEDIRVLRAEVETTARLHRENDGLRADNDDLARRLQETAQKGNVALRAADEWRKAAGQWQEAHVAELTRRRQAEGHRDRLIEDIRGLRAELERLNGEADNAVRVAFERGRQLAALIAEREELRRAIRESAAPLRPYIGD